MSLHVRPRALLAVALLIAAVPAVAATPASAADECPAGEPSCIIVRVVSTVDGRESVEDSYTVTDDQIAQWSDIEDTQYYKRRNLKGELSKGPRVRGGVSLRTLLRSVDAERPDLDQDVTFSETPNAVKIPAVLSDADLADPDDPGDEDYPFDDSLQPAVYPTGGNIGYVRPLRDADKDVNISDIFAVSGPLVLTFHTTGRLLQPTVEASAGTAVKTKTKNTFSVTFGKKPGTRIVSTRWDFGDGSVKGTKREEPTKSYAKQGTYPVVATVRGANGSYGRSAPLEITVDKPPKAPSSGTGGGLGTGGSGFGGGSGGYIPPYDAGTGTLPGDEPGDLTEDELPPMEDSAPLDDGLEPVEGYVLAGAEVVPGGTAEQIPGTQDSSDAAPATQASQRQRIATWAIAALAAALLLAAGATSETRWFRNRLNHLRRRA